MVKGAAQIMPIKGSKRALKALKNISDFGNKRLMEEMGAKAIEIVIKRTLSGVDVKHKPFHPYSKNYIEKRGKQVDLSLTRQMLNAISQNVLDGHTTRIYIQASPRSGEKINNNLLAWVHNEGGRSGRGKGFDMPKREFFWIENRKELIEIERIIVKHIERIIKRL